MISYGPGGLSPDEVIEAQRKKRLEAREAKKAEEAEAKQDLENRFITVAESRAAKIAAWIASTQSNVPVAPCRSQRFADLELQEEAQERKKELDCIAAGSSQDTRRNSQELTAVGERFFQYAQKEALHSQVKEYDDVQ